MRRITGQSQELSKDVQYNGLRNENCKMCPLHETAEHVCLIGRGDLNAKVFLVGEAPGMREDDIGKPFAGRSGKFLEDVLTELGQSRDMVYISNAVHCRPPDNRTPSIKEINKCKLYLEREFNLVRPTVIITMGNTALRAVTGHSGITKFRGTTLDYNGKFKAIVFPTLHPAAILRNPGNMECFVDDIEKAFRIAEDGIASRAKCDWKLITTISEVDDLILLIKDKKRCSVDIEANSVSWHSGDTSIAGIGFSCESGSGYFVPIDHKESPFNDNPDIIRKLSKHIFSNKHVVKIGQNIKYDMHMLMNYGCQFCGTIHDTMFMHYVLDENRGHDLGTISLKYTNYGEYWKEVQQLGLHAGKSTDIDIKKLGEYCVIDADATLISFLAMKAELIRDKKLWNVYKSLLIPAMWCMLEAERRGMTIDLKRLDRLKKEFASEHDRIILELKSFKEVDKFDKIMASEKGKSWKGVNFNSSQQVQRLLFTESGFCTKSVDYTDAGNPKADENALIELIHKRRRVGTFARILLDLRKVNKLDSTYVSGLVKYLCEDKIHPTFRVIGTRTGRMSCKNPNLQQIPRSNPSEYDSPLKAKVKTVYIPTSGYVFLHLDLSQAELRIMTHYSGEKTMLKWFNSNKDVHTHVGAKMLGIGVEDFKKHKDFVAHRKRAKTVNFGTIYEVGKYTLAKNLSSPAEGIFFSPDEAQEFLDEYFQLFPAIRAYIDDQHRRAEKIGYVETLFGLRRRLPDVQSGDRAVRTEALRQATNSPIQGTAGQYTIFGMAYLMGYVDGIRRLPDDCYLVNQIHDSILLEVNGDKVNEIAKIIKDIMENLPTEQYFGFKLSVPIIVEADYSSDSWAKLQKIQW